MDNRYNKPDKGTQNWHVPLNENFDRLDVDVEHRDVEANRDNYPPASNAKFFSVDTGAMYVGDGDAWRSANVNQIYDTTARYLGELTGSADASTVQDAIQDRTPNAGIVITDPGFELDWNEQVDLPANEQDFALRTHGRVTLSIASGFSGSAAMNKPPADQRCHDWAIESFRVIDSDQQLSWALDITDLKNGDIAPWYIEGTPGLILRASNDTTNQVAVYGWRALSERGPLIKTTAGAPSADQCHFYHCSFNQTNSGSGQTAFIDNGNNNNWHNLRVEQANIGIEIGGNQADVHIQDFDRASKGDATVKEVDGGGPSLISGLSKEDRYENLDIYHPQTVVVSGVGDSHSASSNAAAMVDILEPLRKMTLATTPPYTLNENTGGGSIDYPVKMYGPQPALLCGSSQGDYAELNTGGSDMKTQSYPKFAFGPKFDTTTGNLFRAGFFINDSNYAELVYDPTDHLGVVANPSNVNLVTEDGGTVDAVDLNVAPNTSREDLWSLAAVNQSDTRTWVGVVYDGNNDNFYRGESQQDVDGKATLRWYHESRGASNSAVNILQEKGVRCLRF